jgi:hypothetical protein
MSTGTSSGSTTRPSYLSTGIFTAVLIVFALAVLIGVRPLAGWLGYEVDWVATFVLLAFIVGMLIPGYICAMNAESSAGRWGGVAETGSVLLFGGAVLLIGLALIPPRWQSRIQQNLSPFKTASEKAPILALGNVGGDETVKVVIPPGVTADTVFIAIEVPKDKAAQGIPLPQGRGSVSVWYKSGNTVSFSSNL